MRARRLFKIIGYVAFGCVAFGLSLYLTFPTQVLGRRLVHAFNQQAGGQWAVRLDDFELVRFTGVQATGVTVRRLGSSPFDIPVDRARARVRLLPLLWARLEVEAEAELAGGSVRAVIQPKSLHAFALRANVQSLRLDAAEFMTKLAGLPVAGELTAEVVADWTGEARASDAAVNLGLHAARVGPGSVAGFTLPAVGLGELSLGVGLKAGKIEISSFDQKGGDVEAVVFGSGVLRANGGSSTLDACVQFRAQTTFLEANPKLKTAVQLAEVRLRKDGEGFLHVPLSGTVASPRLRGGLCRRHGRTTPTPTPTPMPTPALRPNPSP